MENEQLRTELKRRPLPSEASDFTRCQTLQDKLDEIQSENVELKLKISDLEGDALEDRRIKQISYEYTIENLRSTVH